jgi:hypothetical protein
MNERRSVASVVRQALIAVCLLSPPWPAIAATNEVTLHVETLDDDLRAGGTAWFVMQMKNGSERLTQLTRPGERWASKSRRQFRVAPPAHARWTDVQRVGIRFRPDRGGGLRKADDWQVYFWLGVGAACFDRAPLPAHRIPVGTACPSARETYRFEGDRGEQTRWAALSVVAGTLAVSAAPSASAPGASCTYEGVEYQRDADGDGVEGWVCGGNDCDDADPRRFPGNPEVCDAAGFDEDCDPNTFGDRDLDGDRFVDARCWNDPAQRGVRGVPVGRRLNR